MLDTFGNKPFLRHHSDQEVEFCKCVCSVPISDIPTPAIVIGSHVIYIVKMNDDSSLSLKARIEPQRKFSCGSMRAPQ